MVSEKDYDEFNKGRQDAQRGLANYTFLSDSAFYRQGNLIGKFLRENPFEKITLIQRLDYFLNKYKEKNK